MIPAVRIYDIHDVEHSVAHKGLEPSRVAHQPAQDNCAVRQSLDLSNLCVCSDKRGLYVAESVDHPQVHNSSEGILWRIAESIVVV